MCLFSLLLSVDLSVSRAHSCIHSTYHAYTVHTHHTHMHTNMHAQTGQPYRSGQHRANGSRHHLPPPTPSYPNASRPSAPPLPPPPCPRSKARHPLQPLQPGKSMRTMRSRAADPRGRRMRGGCMGLGKGVRPRTRGCSRRIWPTKSAAVPGCRMISPAPPCASIICRVLYMHMYSHIHTCICMYMYMYMYVCMYVCMHACMYVCRHMIMRRDIVHCVRAPFRPFSSVRHRGVTDMIIDMRKHACALRLAGHGINAVIRTFNLHERFH